jgi:hypothetical protein
VNIPARGWSEIEAPTTNVYNFLTPRPIFAKQAIRLCWYPPGRKRYGLNPDDPRAHDNIGVALAGTGKFDQDHRRVPEIDRTEFR